jgi:hypothetical protein
MTADFSKDDTSIERMKIVHYGILYCMCLCTWNKLEDTRIKTIVFQLEKFFLFIPCFVLNVEFS